MQWPSMKDQVNYDHSQLGNFITTSEQKQLDHAF